MKTIMVWNCGDDLSYAKQEVTQLLGLRSSNWEVFDAGRTMEWENLAKFAKTVNPTIFHFIGHGNARGELEVREDGNTFGRSAADIINVVRAASPNLEGVYLSACFSGKDGPELLNPLPTAGGWMIGTTSTVDDDLAAAFAEKFYRHLIENAASPQTAYKIAHAYVEADWPGEVTHDAWFEQSTLPPISQMARDINSKIRGVFNRSSFRIPMRNEVSMRELDVALQDIGHALGTGEVLSRLTRTVIEAPSFPADWLQDPDIQSFLTDTHRGLANVRKSVAILQTGSPDVDYVVGNVLNFDKKVSQDEWMRRVNKVDRARNQILKAANRLFERSDDLRPLPKIGLSYSSQEIKQAATRASKP